MREKSLLGRASRDNISSHLDVVPVLDRDELLGDVVRVNVVAELLGQLETLRAHLVHFGQNAAHLQIGEFNLLSCSYQYYKCPFALHNSLIDIDSVLKFEVKWANRLIEEE